MYPKFDGEPTSLLELKHPEAFRNWPTFLRVQNAKSFVSGSKDCPSYLSYVRCPCFSGQHSLAHVFWPTPHASTFSAAVRLWATCTDHSSMLKQVSRTNRSSGWGLSLNLIAAELHGQCDRRGVGLTQALQLCVVPELEAVVTQWSVKSRETNLWHASLISLCDTNRSLPEERCACTDWMLAWEAAIDAPQ